MPRWVNVRVESIQEYSNFELGVLSSIYVYARSLRLKGIKTKRFKTIYYRTCVIYSSIYIIYRWLLLNFSRKTNNSNRNFYHIPRYSKTVSHIQLTNIFLALRLIFWIKLKICHTKCKSRSFIKYVSTTSQISQNYQRNYEHNMLIHDKKYIIQMFIRN